MCVSSSFMRWGEVVYVFVCVMSVFLLHVLLRCVLEPSPTCFLLSTPCTLACFWKKGTQEQWSATHAENGRRVQIYVTVMTTFPLACPASRYRIASADSPNGQRL